MKRITLLGLTALALAGCVRFSTDQKDISYDPDTGGRIREIGTKASSTAVFSSKSDLAKWKASQTDKTQGAEVGGLSQSASGTNFVHALGHLEGILKAIRPTP